MRDVAGWIALLLVGAPLVFATAAALMLGLRTRLGRVGAMLVIAAVLFVTWRTEVELRAASEWVLVAAAAAGVLAPLVWKERREKSASPSRGR